jgi:hypothetical protein
MPPSSAASDLSPPWGLLDLPEGEIQAIRLGPRDFWIVARDGEIWVALGPVGAPAESGATTAEGKPQAPEPPQGTEWARWATPGGESQIVLRPALPERTLVIQPELPFRLLPRAEARVFVRVPLSVRVELPPPAGEGGSGAGPLLTQFATFVLSDTWWGDVMDGELAYWVPTTARRVLRPELHQPHLAVCPLNLINRSGTELGVEKLALRVAHLSLFDWEGAGLWGDETRVTYQGSSEGSQVEMSGQAPPESLGGRLVVPPREPLQRGIRARTFDRLRSFSSPGLQP